MFVRYFYVVFDVNLTVIAAESDVVNVVAFIGFTTGMFRKVKISY